MASQDHLVTGAHALASESKTAAEVAERGAAALAAWENGGREADAQANRDEINRNATTANPEQIHHSHRRASRATDQTAAEWSAHVEECLPCATWEVETAKANLAKQTGYSANVRPTLAAEKRLAKAVARLAKAAR